MKICILKISLLAGLLLFSAFPLRADEEQDLIAKLGSSAATAEKCTACVRLRIVGTTNSIAPLSALLLDQGTAHAARYALEGLPFPEAVAALRQALPRADGLVKVGLIDSLGRKHDNSRLAASSPINSCLTGSQVSGRRKIIEMPPIRIAFIV